jgi:enolase
VVDEREELVRNAGIELDDTKNRERFEGMLRMGVSTSIAVAAMLLRSAF